MSIACKSHPTHSQQPPLDIHQIGEGKKVVRVQPVDLPGGTFFQHTEIACKITAVEGGARNFILAPLFPILMITYPRSGWEETLFEPRTKRDPQLALHGFQEHFVTLIPGT